MLATAAVFIALAVPGGHAEKPVCQTRRCEARVARRAARRAFRREQRALRHRCWKGDTGACIDRAAGLYRVSRWVLRNRAMCESRMNPSAYNPSGASGLFQFMPGTWATTRYGKRGKSVWSAKWASLGAAEYERAGLGYHWVCR